MCSENMFFDNFFYENCFFFAKNIYLCELSNVYKTTFRQQKSLKETTH